MYQKGISEGKYVEVYVKLIGYLNKAIFIRDSIIPEMVIHIIIIIHKSFIIGLQKDGSIKMLENSVIARRGDE